MASAEQLLNEAQYALHSINSGESRDNGRNASRARALSKKIIRKFPTSTEANSAHSILRRLGDEAYVSGLGAPHEGVVEHVFHKAQSPESQQRRTQSDERVGRHLLCQLVAILRRVDVAAAQLLSFGERDTVHQGVDTVDGFAERTEELFDFFLPSDVTLRDESVFG